MYAILNGEARVCRERITYPGNRVIWCPFCDTSHLGGPPLACKCKAIFTAEPPVPQEAPVPTETPPTMEKEALPLQPTPESVGESHPRKQKGKRG